MAVDEIYGEECSELAEKAGKKIIGSISGHIKCNHCGNLSFFVPIASDMELDESQILSNYNMNYNMNDNDLYESDWKAHYYYLIKCKICGNISLCTFKTTGNDEVGLEDYLLEEVPKYNISSEEVKEKILQATEFKMLFPMYDKQNLIVNEELKKQFPKVMEIYKQAQIAENLKLNYICGMAYRKALEFLIKDYCIKMNNCCKSDIEKQILSNVINKYIDNEDIKNCANRAAWLGNDETHYVKKWLDKDVNDLKILLNLTINWVLSQEKIKQYVESMK